MFPKVELSSFKRFATLEVDLKKEGLVVGPNNSGKTTVLQAVAFASEVAEVWYKRITEEDLDYRNADAIEVDLLSYFSIALERSDQLWYNQDTQEPITIRIVTDSFDVGFSVTYKNTNVASIRPSSKTRTRDLEKYAQAPFTAIYIPSLSGLDVEEAKYAAAAVRARLARGQGGSVLRSMLSAISSDEEKWAKLQQTVKTLFDGTEISQPTGVDPIQIRYRDSKTNPWYSLINASAGLLQTVLIQSALLYSEAQYLLIDEPDAHLHELLTESIYQIIREHCDSNNSSALIATHSNRLIDASTKEGDGNLSLISSEGLRHVKKGDAKELLNIPFSEIVLAETSQRILYVEGSTDLNFLRAWAAVLDHPASQYLKAPYCIETAKRPGRGFSKNHYHALRAQVPTLRALEIKDPNGDEKKAGQGLSRERFRHKQGKALPIVYWGRREIESYLYHPTTLQRFIAPQLGNERATEIVNDQFPPAVIRKPFDDANSPQPDKDTIKGFLNRAGVNLREAEYYKIARCMIPEEVHPDIVTMLGIIQLGLMNER
ncbi:MAG: AAA family ATPase [Aestuariivita sp.]|nr:AAA family ATPase [Aestuariivita sp.]